MGLAGCEKTEPGTQAPAAATPIQKPASTNSFDAVTAQLDPGGDLYLYLSTAQWMARSQGLDILHDATLSGSGSETVENREKAEKSFAALKDIVQKSGLEEITALAPVPSR